MSPQLNDAQYIFINLERITTVDIYRIDKSNNAELTEAINSTFRWYRHAAKCYVYLSDVPKDAPDADDAFCQLPWESAFCKSRWFTRGWTLEELIAPPLVEFFSSNGNRLGIFGISIPVIYGEGKESAFRRLNREWKYRVDELSQDTSNYAKRFGALQQTLEGYSDAVYSVAFSPNSRLLERHGDFIKSVAFSPNSRLLASASVDKTVLWTRS
ncbi:hypothetical protein BKA61DRAFT_728519 [Leptodontidium sp. MPI-SDFR-AT-0119]|nr:hypothetical protein BKA61DRAFT_728519 [Leptodontidium sp. MPI-SDFR-AT-0119]